MKKIRTHAAGIDIGARKIFVGLEGKEVKSFDTFTEDLEAAASYLLENNVDTVAMETTGVYWIILYDIL
ncbi:IS110 family transposase, partial [Salegentibacter sp. LM13S]|nr:IS110 family transposase [Salegentibacter lacus]MBZ9632702.1 IS110 family transposase [Salegentibacter lacus]